MSSLDKMSVTSLGEGTSVSFSASLVGEVLESGSF